MENKGIFNIPDINVIHVYWSYEEYTTSPWNYKSRLDNWISDYPEYKYKYGLRWHLSGSHNFTADGKSHEVNDKFSLVLENFSKDDYIPYYRSSVDLPNHYIAIQFSTDKPIDKAYFEHNIMRVYPKKKQERLTEIFTYAYHLFPTGTASRKFEAKAIIYEALAVLFKTYHNIEFHNLPQNIMIKTASYIDEHFFDKNLSVKELAENAHISTVHFSRLFSQTFGISPKKYIIDKKLKGVASYLVHTGMSVNAICDKMGFNDMSYFNRLFKKKYDMSPREYRNIHRM